MPDVGFYEKTPRPESIQKLIDYLEGNPRVSEIRRDAEQTITVVRKGMPDIRVYMTNIYIVGLADVYDIMSQGKFDAIVTMSAWNAYTSEAKRLTKDNGVGLFTFKEMLGAAYWAGGKFLDYVTPEKGR